MSRTSQLISWTLGKSKHHDGKCVPDYSCCQKPVYTCDDEISLRSRYLEAYSKNDIITMIAISRFYVQKMTKEILIFDGDSDDKH